jgi:hypothetical protein
METKELKFILKLLGCPNYRTGLSSSTFDSFKSEKNKICRDLGELEYVDYSREVATVKILPAGQALLKLDSTQLPIDNQELKVLEKISKSSGKIAPSEIKVSGLKSDERDVILKTLSERGLIAAEIKMKMRNADVWLTERGIEVLRDEYNPEGKANIDFNLLGNYLRFLRKTLVSDPHINEKPASDEEIFQIIKKLDRDLRKNNYLPIFHLRQKLQPRLSRNELDQALYRLEEANQIELSTLAEPGGGVYSPEELDAGISQISGGSLFFITIN